MAVILGITNGKETDINLMYQQVRHRGQDNFKVEKSGDHFSISARHNNDNTIRKSSGIYKDERVLVAIAGSVLNKAYERLSPEAVAKIFLTKGIRFLDDIQGAFVMVLQTTTHLYLIRDATGQRTLYYNHQGKRLSYCVEAKGIHALPYFVPQLNRDAVFQYFSYSFIPLGSTMLQNVRELPAGAILSYDLLKNKLQVERYFKLENIQKNVITDLNYWVSRIREEVSEEVVDKLQDQEDVGVFLSGGLDSSIITAEVATRHKKKIHTFSIHFGKAYQNELDFAKLVADRYGTQHHEVEIRPKDFIPKLRNTIWYLDDPIGDPITIPNFELAKYAADFVPVIFNGEGGDPCFGGPKNIPMLLGHWYGGIERPRNYREQSYLASYRRGYHYLEQLLAPDFLGEYDPARQLESILTPFFKEPNFNFLDKLMSINIRLKGAHLILPKVERMLGASGLPAVAPLFTKAITASSMEMPSVLKLNKGVEKYILKQAFKQDVPMPIIERPKSGMRVPVRYWFQGEMKKYSQKILNSRDIKRVGIFNPDTIKQLLAYDTESGLRRHGLLIWMVLTFEIWRRIFIEKEPL